MRQVALLLSPSMRRALERLERDVELVRIELARDRCRRSGVPAPQGGRVDPAGRGRGKPGFVSGSNSVRNPNNLAVSRGVVRKGLQVALKVLKGGGRSRKPGGGRA
jgi:hypothetical protein